MPQSPEVMGTACQLTDLISTCLVTVIIIVTVTAFAVTRRHTRSSGGVLVYQSSQAVKHLPLVTCCLCYVI